MLDYASSSQPAATVWQSSTFQGHHRYRDREREEEIEDEGESQGINTDPKASDSHSSLVSPIWDFSLTAAPCPHLHKMQFMTPERSQATDEHFKE